MGFNPLKNSLLLQNRWGGWCRGLLCALVLNLMIIGGAGGGEQFRYVDPNGVVHWLEDKSALPPSVRQQHKYIDRNGVTFWVDNPESIPEEYRTPSDAVAGDGTPPPKEVPPTVALIQSSTPISIKNNQILVTVVFRNKGKRVRARMILDTGASVTTIYGSVASRLNLKKNRLSRGSSLSANGSVTDTLLTKVDYIEVDDKVLANAEVMVMPTMSTMGIDGLLGNTFLRYFNFTIDYEKQLLIWNPASSAPPPPH